MDKTGYISEPRLFLSANNNINCAKTLINECKRLINEVKLDGNEYNNCKSNIENCGIDKLIDIVDKTKESLFNLDQSFANEYMSLIEDYLQTGTVDISNMSEEEQLEYNIKMNAYYRDYNTNLLYILEKYENSDMLTPELQNKLEIQRIIVKQYDLQDEMSIMDISSDEYLKKFKENAEYDVKLINLNTDLTEEEKKVKIEEYNIKFESNLSKLQLNVNIQNKTDELSNLKAGSKEYYQKENEIIQLQIDYYENKVDLTEEESNKLNTLKDYNKLNDLYIKDYDLENNWIPFDGSDLDEEIYQLKKDMGIATQAEIDYLNMSPYDKFWNNTGAVVGGFFEGVYNVEETIFDGAVMGCGKVGSWFGADTKWAEDLVKIDLSGDAYRSFVLGTGMNDTIAYGDAHTVSNFVGEMAGTISLQFVFPGGNTALTSTLSTVGMSSLHGLKGMGSSSEKALLGGKDFNASFNYGAFNGTIEAVSSAVLYGTVTKTVRYRPETTKFVEKIPNWVNNKIPGISKLTGSVSKGYKNVLSHMPTKVQDYAKSEIKPSLGMKLFVAGGKEFAKEGTNLAIGEEFNFVNAFTEATKAVITTSFNELVVSPVVNAVTNKSSHSKEISKSVTKAKQAKRRKAQLEEKIDKLKKNTEAEADDMVEDLLIKSKNGRSVGDAHTKDSLSQLKQGLSKQANNIEHAYDNVSLWKELVGKDFVNKFAKKMGTGFMDDKIYGEGL